MVKVPDRWSLGAMRALSAVLGRRVGGVTRVSQMADQLTGLHGAGAPDVVAQVRVVIGVAVDALEGDGKAGIKDLKVIDIGLNADGSTTAST